MRLRMQLGIETLYLLDNSFVRSLNLNRLFFRSHRFNLKVHWLCSFVAVNECMAAAAAAAATEYAQSMNER